MKVAENNFDICKKKKKKMHETMKGEIIRRLEGWGQGDAESGGGGWGEMERENGVCGGGGEGEGGSREKDRAG